MADSRHNTVASWFLGPRAENFDILEKLFKMALQTQFQGRQEYFPEDPLFITSEIRASSQFQEAVEQLERVVTCISGLMTIHHVPFWNPRYNAHMLMDTTLPGIAGYITAMIFNPNNVATEASPLTTVLERDVGSQLCSMIGIDTKGWGHITCGGSVANLESIWGARNLKFYPLSLTLATENDGPLSFIRDTFILPTCTGTEKLFKDFTTWELLNITPDIVLDMPDRLYKQYLISPTFLQNVMTKYIIQTTPKDDPVFTERFARDGIRLDDMALVTSATKHYSWPKGAAITGIGSANLINVQVDFDARMEMKDLRVKLDECLAKKRAIYAVIAIIGSTEHGACDPLKDMVEIRKEYQKKGLSFVLHADGAWGTYYHSMLNPRNLADDRSDTSVPMMSLKQETKDSLRHLRYCETITVDPHKSGYIQYPAGGLLYRDGRMRYLITWTSPVVFREGEESMGVYGVEGSKPGASPAAVWISNAVIGLDQDGYGALLGEGIFGATIMYSHLATMSTPSTDFRVTTLNMLPAEISGGSVKAQKEFIRTRILPVQNSELVKDKEAMALIAKMGSDLSINAFAVNFRVNGTVNQDVVEANNLNMRIFQRLSITTLDDDINTRPLILTSTQLAQSEYTQCLDNFKRRLGLVGDQDLYTLINVVSSPFPTQRGFSREIAQALQSVIEEEVKVSQYRNTVTPSLHGFVMQGVSDIHLVHLPMFNMANQRNQLIITGDLPPDILDKYNEAQRQNPNKYFILAMSEPEILMEMIERGRFEATIDIGLPPSDGTHLLSGFKFTNIRVTKNIPLDSKFLTSYPEKSMPFYVYGTKRGGWHIEHALLASPNIQLNADRVLLDPHLQSYIETYGVLVLQVPLPEAAMQPFPPNKQIVNDPTFFFRPGVKFRVAVTRDVDSTQTLTEGTLEIPKDSRTFIDADMLNMEPTRVTTSKGEGRTGVPEAPDHVPLVLHGSFEYYAGRETDDRPSIPLLSNLGPSMGEIYLSAVKSAVSGES